MYSNLAPGQIGIQKLALRDLVDLASRHGFGGVDLPMDQITTNAQADAAEELVTSRDLRWGLFWLPGNFLGDEPAFDEGMVKLGEMLPRVKRAGGRRTYDHIWPGHDERDYKTNFAFHVERLKPLRDVLQAHGVTMGLEFIGPRTKREGLKHAFVHRLDQVLELIEAVGDGVGVVLDFFHWYCSGATLDDLDQLEGVPIVNVHANDAREDRSRDQQLDHERAMPMATGIIDGEGIMAKLIGLGYDGPIIVEPFQPAREELAALGPEVAASAAVSSLDRLIQAGRERLGHGVR